jgi:hypothetical protein
MLRLRSDRIQLEHHSRWTVQASSSLSELGSWWFPTITMTHSASEIFELESHEGG